MAALIFQGAAAVGTLFHIDLEDRLSSQAQLRRIGAEGGGASPWSADDRGAGRSGEIDWSDDSHCRAIPHRDIETVGPTDVFMSLFGPNSRYGR
jgi:hypothetical protein